ncbi:MAG: biotin/lipoyl-containing protein [Chloroflexota bacterium]
MKIKVKVENILYEVEIEELNTLPVIARIGDETFEIWPEIDKLPAEQPNRSQRQPIFPGMVSSSKDKVVSAPLPGIVTEIYIKPGDAINKGAPLLVIEAMKMKNKIHAGQSGIISNVRIKIGDSVKHNQALIEFVE